MAERSELWRARGVRLAGLAAGACFLLALGGFGAALDGYDQLRHPVALPGAEGMPRAILFNLLAYVVPGLLAGLVALRRRGALGAGARLSARLGWTIALLAALAFAAQGIWPLETSGPDDGTGRLHGVAWGLWVVAFTAAAAALSFSALRARRLPAMLGHSAAGAAVFALAWLAGDALPAALSQRAAFACWFVWLACVGWGKGARAAVDRGRLSLRRPYASRDCAPLPELAQRCVAVPAAVGLEVPFRWPSPRVRPRPDA